MHIQKLFAAFTSVCMAATSLLGSAVIQTVAAEDKNVAVFDIRSNGKNTVEISSESIAAGNIAIPVQIYVPTNPGVNGIQLKFQVNDGEIDKDGRFGNYGFTISEGTVASPYCFDSANKGNPDEAWSFYFTTEAMNLGWIFSMEDDVLADANAEPNTTAWDAPSWAYDYAFATCTLMVPKGTEAGTYTFDVRREKYINVLTIGLNQIVYGQSTILGNNGHVEYDTIPLTIIVGDEAAATTTTAVTTTNTVTDVTTTVSDAPVTTTNATDVTTVATVAPITTTKATDVTTKGTDAPVTTTKATDVTTKATVAPITTTKATDVTTKVTDAPITTTKATDVTTKGTDAPVTTTKVTDVTTIATDAPITTTKATDVTTIATVAPVTTTKATDVTTVATVAPITTTKATDVTTKATDAPITTTKATDVTTTLGGFTTAPTTATQTTSAPITTTIAAPAWQDTAKAMDEGFYWNIDDVAAKPGDTVSLNVYVFGDLGTAGVTAWFEYDKALELTAMNKGKAYKVNPTINTESYPACLTFANTKGSSQAAEDGSIVVTLEFKVPEDAKAGSVYRVATAEEYDADTLTEIIDMDGKNYPVIFIDGSITVLGADNEVALNYTNYTFSEEGETLDLALLNWSGEVTWSSSDESVAKVNAYGLVTCESLGEAVITATAGDKQYTCKISGGLFGDVDGNGEIDPTDATMVLFQFAAEMMDDDFLTEAQKAVADVNGDGAITEVDATMILRWYSYNFILDNPVSWYELTKNPKAPGANA